MAATSIAIEAPIQMPAPSSHYFEVTAYDGTLKNADIAEAVYEPDPRERSAALSTKVPEDFNATNLTNWFNFWFLQPIFLGAQAPAYVEIQVRRPADLKTEAKRRSVAEIAVNGAEFGSYILRGPKFWGYISFLDEDQKSWANAYPTDAGGNILSCGVQFTHLPQEAKPEAASRINAMIQNVVLK